MQLSGHLENPIFKIVADEARKLGAEAFVIGGYVRDILLGRESKDIDIVVAGSGIELAQNVASKLGKNILVTVFKNFGTAMIHHNGLDVEFVGARKESYRADSRKPLVENGSLEDDQNRRDFTINAMAFSLNEFDFGSLIDPFGGHHDLEKKIIRTPLEPDITFSDDPLRMMRAVRFAAQLGFTIEEKTLAAIQRNGKRLAIVSKERITDELNKMMLAPFPSDGFIYMQETGLLEVVLPWVAALQGVEKIGGSGHKDNFFHTIKVLDRVAQRTDNLWLRWAALLHDIAKPLVKKYSEETGWTFHGHEVKGERMVHDIFRELKLPLNEKMKYVQKLVLLHLRPARLAEDEITDSAIRRLLFEAGDTIDDLMLLCEADITSKNQQKVIKYLKNFEIVRHKLAEIEQKDKLRNWQPPVTGEMIMQTFDLQPCREVGIIKNAIREAILDGKIENNYTEAFNFMIDEAKKINIIQKK
ncbi:MAG: HD domain-containing protein [Bacteroidota bacterium]